MAVATLDAVIAMSITALINRCTQRDFFRGLGREPCVKHHEPLGEETLANIRLCPVLLPLPRLGQTLGNRQEDCKGVSVSHLPSR